LPIETPVDLEDYEFIRWYLVHDHATVFTDDDQWYIMIHTTCRHLQTDNRCGIYDTRPQICRDYTTDNCEFEDDWTYDLYFEAPEQIRQYAEAVLQLKTNGSIRSSKPNLLPVLS
jgi:Fe-S-cluster containining protein